jgi:hypothetical protein
MGFNIRNAILIILLIVLLLFGPALMIYSYAHPDFKLPDILSAGSTYAVAVLTVGYVLTTSRQLDIMRDQLDEAKRNRELSNQPLPWIQQIELLIERPRLFTVPNFNYSGSGNEVEYSFYSRYHFEHKVKNIGNSPAVAVDISTILAIPHNDTPLKFGAVSERIDVLEPGEIYPPNTSHNLSHLFASDSKGETLGSLREMHPQKVPYLLLRIIYKNILGGCFLIDNKFIIYPKDDNQYEIIKKWLTSIAAFPIEYKYDINTLYQLRKENKEKCDELYNKIKEKVNNSTIEEDIKLNVIQVPGVLKIQAISIDQYNELMKNLQYGTPLPPIHHSCLKLEPQT